MPEPMSDERLAEIERRLSDPHTYGAVGDGVTDDYPAVQAALNVSKDVGALIAEVRRLREVLKPFAHHAMAGMDVRSDRERQIRVTEGQLVRADFALMGREFPE